MSRFFNRFGFVKVRKYSHYLVQFRIALSDVEKYNSGLVKFEKNSVKPVYKILVRVWFDSLVFNNGFASRYRPNAKKKQQNWIVTGPTKSPAISNRLRVSFFHEFSTTREPENFFKISREFREISVIPKSSGFPGFGKFPKYFAGKFFELDYFEIVFSFSAFQIYS